MPMFSSIGKDKELCTFMRSKVTKLNAKRIRDKVRILGSFLKEMPLKASYFELQASQKY